MSGTTTTHRREGALLVITLKRERLLSQPALWGAMALVLFGAALFFAPIPQGVDGPWPIYGAWASLALGGLCALRAGLRAGRGYDLLCDRENGVVSCHALERRHRQQAPRWRRPVGARIRAQLVDGPQHSGMRRYTWIFLRSEDGPPLILKGRWNRADAGNIIAAMESYFGAFAPIESECPTNAPADIPELPLDTQLYPHVEEGAFYIEFPPEKQRTRWILCGIVGGLFLWAYGAYLFQGPFDTAWIEGAYGHIAVVTALFLGFPSLLLGHSFLRAIRHRQMLILEDPFLVYREQRVFGAREMIFHESEMLSVEIGPETLGGNREIIRLQHRQGLAEWGRHIETKDRDWLLKLLEARLAGASAQTLASGSRVASFALAPRSSGAQAPAPIVEVFRARAADAPEPARPPMIRARLESEGERMTMEAPARGLSVLHGAVLGAAGALGLLLGGYWLLALIPAGLGVLYDATRRTRLEVSPEGLSVETRWKLGHRQWRTTPEDLREMDLCRATARPSALLSGEGYVLRARSTESEADFGHGLSRRELAWLRDRALRAAAWGAEQVNALDTLELDGESTGHGLPKKGPLNSAEYLSHTLGKAMDSSRYFLLEIDKAPVDQENQDAKKMMDLTILGTLAAGIIPLGGYGIYLGLTDPSPASLYRIPLGAGLISLMPAMLLASLYREVVILDRAGRLAVQAKTLLLPPALLPLPLVQHAARRGHIHELDSFDDVRVVEEKDPQGQPYFQVCLNGPRPLAIKRQRNRDAAQAYGRAIARFTGLQFADLQES